VQKLNDEDFLFKRMNKPIIYIENKFDSMNIDEEITIDFINHSNNNKHNGILVSHNSGIVNKYDYEIQIYDGHIFVFLQNTNFDIDKIKNAINIIDVLYEKLEIMNSNSNIYNISNEVLNEINQEFQLFLVQKNDIHECLKDMNKKISAKIENLKFSSLEKYLSTKIDNVKKTGQHRCSLCNNYTSNTLKGIAAHKRGCIKKMNKY
jgi:hypothetical protein